jgi:hypothetical protein
LPFMMVIVLNVCQPTSFRYVCLIMFMLRNWGTHVQAHQFLLMEVDTVNNLSEIHSILTQLIPMNTSLHSVMVKAQILNFCCFSSS